MFNVEIVGCNVFIHFLTIQMLIGYIYTSVHWVTETQSCLLF